MWRRAESLVEVIVAIFVVSMGAAAATTLIVTAMQSNVFSKDNLIGLNLAVEGIEAMRNIRDTNWIKFGFDKDSCWNIVPEAGPGDCTPDANLIEPDVYAMVLKPDTYAWQLSAPMVDNALDLKNGALEAANEHYRLGFLDTSDEDTNGNGEAFDDPDLYVAEPFKGDPTPDPGVSKFYRMVEVTYPESGDAAADNEMQVRVLVQWRGGNAVHSIDLSSTLNNYQ